MIPPIQHSSESCCLAVEPKHFPLAIVFVFIIVKHIDMYVMLKNTISDVS